VSTNFKSPHATQTSSLRTGKRSDKSDDFRFTSGSTKKVTAGRLYRANGHASLLLDGGKRFPIENHQWLYLEEGDVVLVLRFEDNPSISLNASVGWRPGTVVYLLVNDRVAFMENIDLFASWFEEIEGQ
jgi:hypothetical protein